MNARFEEKTLVKKVLARMSLEITIVDVHVASTVMVNQAVKDLVSSQLLQVISFLCIFL